MITIDKPKSIPTKVDNSPRIAIRDMTMKEYIKHGLPTRGQGEYDKNYISNN